MKPIVFFISTFTIIIGITSCEKVIDYNLNDSTPRYVIEGVLTNQAGQCWVRVTKSVNFDESNTFPPISNALVVISDDLGKNDTLLESATGFYSLPSLKGLSGVTYKLSVIIDDKSFIAYSTMPVQVNFDSIDFSKISMFGGAQTVPVPVYKDPEHSNNYYRFVELVNGKKLEAIFVRDDHQSDGRIVRQPLIDFSDNAANSGDSICIQMMCIDAGVYEYFFSLSQISGGGQNQTGTPANPISNISGGALGYFSAQTIQEKTVLTPKK